MGTLPKHHHGTTRGKYPVECGYCGAVFPRDRMRKDGTGLFVCPDDQGGRDRSTLDRINAGVRPFRGPAPADAPVHTYASPTNPYPDWEPGDGYPAPPPPPSTPLDNIGTSPRFAGWTGGLLRAAYAGHVIRIRRGDNGSLLDVDALGDVVDVGAIAEHCVGSTGYLVTLYDQSGNGYNITQGDTTKQPVVYSESALGEIAVGITHVSGPVLGANGYLGAWFDGEINVVPERVKYLEVSGALGLVGDVALTLAGDAAFSEHTAVLDGIYSGNYSSLLSIGGDGGRPGNRIFGFSAATGSYVADESAGDTITLEGDYGADSYVVNVNSRLSKSFGWLADRAAGAIIEDVRAFHNGTQVPLTLYNEFDIGGVSTSIPASSTQLRWGSYAPFSELYPFRGVMASAFVWNSVLSNRDRSALNTWQASVRS